MTIGEFIPYIIAQSVVLGSIAFIPCWVIFLIVMQIRKSNARKHKRRM